MAEKAQVEDLRELSDDVTTEVSQKSDANPENHEGSSSSVKKNDEIDAGTMQEVELSEEIEKVETEVSQKSDVNAENHDSEDNHEGDNNVTKTVLNNPDDKVSKVQGIMRKVFDRADTNRSGTLTHDEVSLCLRQLGWNDVTARSVFQFLDVDDSHSLSFAEFLHWSEFAWESRVLSVPKSMPSGGLSSHSMGTTLDAVQETKSDVLDEVLEDEEDEEEDARVKQILNPYQFETARSAQSGPKVNTDKEEEIDDPLVNGEVATNDRRPDKVKPGDTSHYTASMAEKAQVEDLSEVSQKSDVNAENHEGSSSTSSRVNKNDDTDTNTMQEVRLSEEKEAVEMEALQMQTPDAEINEKSDTADIGKVAGDDANTDELSEWMEVVKDEVRASGVSETSDAHPDNAAETAAETEYVDFGDASELTENVTTEVSQKSDVKVSCVDNIDTVANKDVSVDDGLSDEMRAVKHELGAAKMIGAVEPGCANQNTAAIKEARVEDLSEWLENTKAESSLKSDANVESKKISSTNDRDEFARDNSNVDDLSGWTEVVKNELPGAHDAEDTDTVTQEDGKDHGFSEFIEVAKDTTHLDKSEGSTDLNERSDGTAILPGGLDSMNKDARTNAAAALAAANSVLASDSTPV